MMDSKTNEESREKPIEDAVLKDCAKLGFPDALAIRNGAIFDRSGRADVILLQRIESPERQQAKIAFIEAKRVSNAASRGSVVGQLLRYYAGALHVGSDGISALRKFACDRAAAWECITNKLVTAYFGNSLTKEQATAAMFRGEKLRRDEIKLYVALNDKPAPTLTWILELLRSDHDLKIGLIITCNGSIDEEASILD